MTNAAVASHSNQWRGENKKKTILLNLAEKTAAVQIGHSAINIFTFLFVIFTFIRLLIRRMPFIARNELIYLITRLKSIPKVVFDKFSFSINSRIKMCSRTVKSAISIVSRNVRRFGTKVRLDMIEENVVLEQITKKTYNINFARVGSGPNAIILMPGAVGSIETDFEPQIDGLPTLVANHTIIAWDPPGYGKSRPPERTFPIGFYHRDAFLADALMRQLGFGKYSIVGWSDGGTTGLIMASHYPDAVEKLAIWGSGPIINRTDVEICQSIQERN